MLLLLLAAFELAASPAQESKTADQRERLETIQQQLKEKQAEYNQMTGKEENLLGELRPIEQALQEAQQKVQEANANLARNKEELKKIQTELARLQKKYEQSNGVFAKRLRAIYKMGDLGYLTPLLAMSAPDHLQQQLKYLQRIAASDRQLLKAAEKDIQAMLVQKTAFEQHKQEIVQAQKDIEQQNLLVAAQKKQKTDVLAKIRQDKDQYAKVMAELEESAGKLEHFLQNLEAKAEPSLSEKLIRKGKNIIFPENPQEVVQAYGQNFRANKGKMLWPVQGRIITNFGPLKMGDTFTYYKGVDIQANNGTPFYAVFKGTVKYADWFEGYGNLVIVDHGGNFYTLYAHADALAVKSGATVETRQVLGKVGDTDSLKGAYLYFEIRANGKPENPQTWLAKVE